MKITHWRSLFNIQYSLKKKCTWKIFTHYSIYLTTTTTKKHPLKILIYYSIYSQEKAYTLKNQKHLFICLLVGLSAGWQREEMINWFTNWLTDLRYCLWLNAEWVIKKIKYICSSRHLWLQTLLFHSNLTNTKSTYMYTDTMIKTWVKGRFPLATHSTLQVLISSTFPPSSAVTGYMPAPGKKYFHLDLNKFCFTNGRIMYGSVTKETWPDIICVVCVVTNLLPF